MRPDAPEVALLDPAFSTDRERRRDPAAWLAAGLPTVVAVVCALSAVTSIPREPIALPSILKVMQRELRLRQR